MANVNLRTMRKPHGNSIIIMPGEADQERDTFQCPHCGRHRRMPVAALGDRGQYCHMCNQPRCSSKKCQVCVPFEKKMEAYERREVLTGALTKMLL